ncbi:hypothetical protein Q0812_07875 [Brevundimonas sp. 2R-24]|uniref:Uncharacterized protein n=1 Tax=Peiella sedimenti TaxID=3061083 RepID=A0ABT8SLI6_9CAUL|nr:hypothetical protein [Caulobacteraceae bacterium XZ-24]
MEPLEIKPARRVRNPSRPLAFWAVYGLAALTLVTAVLALLALE